MECPLALVSIGLDPERRPILILDCLVTFLCLLFVELACKLLENLGWLFQQP